MPILTVNASVTVRFVVRCLLSLLFGLIAIPALAQAPAAREEARHHLLPWRLKGLTAEYKLAIKPALAAMRTRLAEAVFVDSRPLLEGLPDNKAALPLTVNMRGLVADVLSGNLREALAGPALVYEPRICAVADHLLIGIAALELTKNKLLAFGHTAVKRPKENVAAEPAWQDVIDLAWQRTDDRLRAPATDSSAFQIGLSLAGSHSRLDQAPGDCLNLLVAEQLAAQGTEVTPLLGSEVVRALQHLLGRRATDRATRRFINYWTWLEQEFRPSLPAKLSLRTAMSTAVMANGFGEVPVTSWELLFDPERNQLRFDLPEAFRQLIAREKRGLEHGEAPAIAAIRRAWVYLDRGRAWGLRMGDRLVSNDAAGQLITGHVVGFYGPELKLQSPRGHEVREGAILFIRKGQRQTRVGQVFTYDKRSYPSPWPPDGQGRKI